MSNREDITKLLIDSDSIAYRAAASAQGAEWVVEDTGSMSVLHRTKYKKDAVAWVEANVHDDELDNILYTKEFTPEDVSHALHNIKTMVKGIEDFFPNVTEHTHYLTGSVNYRDEVATIAPYKGNRDSSNKPYHLPACREFLGTKYGAVIVEGYEADDACSMAQRNDTCIVSIDKDLNTVPGWHFNWVKQELYYVTIEEAEYFFWQQMIQGDTTDNIKGVPRYGEKKAKKVLDEALANGVSLACAVGHLYADAYANPESAFEENARLLWMSLEFPNDWSWDLIGDVDED